MTKIYYMKNEYEENNHVLESSKKQANGTLLKMITQRPERTRILSQY